MLKSYWANDRKSETLLRYRLYLAKVDYVKKEFDNMWNVSHVTTQARCANDNKAV